LIVPEDNMLIDIDCESFQRATLSNEAERVSVKSSITGWRRIEWNLSTPKAATGAENPQCIDPKASIIFKTTQKALDDAVVVVCTVNVFCFVVGPSLRM
jgi:hypothetical protein